MARFEPGSFCLEASTDPPTLYARHSTVIRNNYLSTISYINNQPYRLRGRTALCRDTLLQHNAERDEQPTYLTTGWNFEAKFRPWNWTTTIKKHGSVNEKKFWTSYTNGRSQHNEYRRYYFFFHLRTHVSWGKLFSFIAWNYPQNLSTYFNFTLYL